MREFCHTIDGILGRIDLGWNERRNAACQNAAEKKLYYQTYASRNPGEYWAEIAQAYFDCNRITTAPWATAPN